MQVVYARQVLQRQLSKESSWPMHKKNVSYKQVTLHEALFKDPPPKEECPIFGGLLVDGCVYNEEYYRILALVYFPLRGLGDGGA
jgi:hypothetical protein